MIVLIATVLIVAPAATQGSWTAVPSQYVSINLETTPLEIKTDSAVGSRHSTRIYFMTADLDSVGRVFFNFGRTPDYSIGRCGNRDFPATLPTARNKNWRITKTKTSDNVRLQIHCNDVEVVNLLFSDTVCGAGGSEPWTKDIEKIQFDNVDTASDYYKLSSEGDWIPVKIEFDLETNPLEIKTDSEIGSGDQLKVNFYDSVGDVAGAVIIDFFSTAKYNFHWCSSPSAFPATLPIARSKVWRITKTRMSEDIRFQIHCNGVEMLNVVLSSTFCADDGRWNIYYPRHIKRIYFSERYPASDYYRPYPGGCTGINTELASTMETTAKFPVHSGTVVEVTCSDPKAILKGSNRVTCVSGTGFSYMEEPMCSLPGNHCDVIVISN